MQVVLESDGAAQYPDDRQALFGFTQNPAKQLLSRHNTTLQVGAATL